MADKAPDSKAGTPTPGAGGAGASFTEREMTTLAFAFRSLKSGPPEVCILIDTSPPLSLPAHTTQIDYDKLAGYLGMTNPRSASNAWTKIKAKLNANEPPTGAVTPNKRGGRKKAASKASVDGENGDSGDADAPATPKQKSPRKRAAKKQESEVEGQENASPKKRGRLATRAADAQAEVDAEAESTLSFLFLSVSLCSWFRSVWNVF